MIMTNIHIITASAGSGKTYRLATLLHQSIASGSVRPEAVIATTFTKKAAAELQERVRRRLIREGLIVEANRLGAARMGTVNAVCSGLVMNFVFEKGLFAETVVLDEKAASRELRRALSSVVKGGVSARMTELSSRLEAFEWTGVVESLIQFAGYNGLKETDLKASKQKSIRSISQLIGKPLGPDRDLDGELQTALSDFIRSVDLEEDQTGGTAGAVQKAEACLSRLREGRPLPWSDWLRLDRIKVGKKSVVHAEQLRQVAALHDNHPNLRKDLTDAVELVFDTGIAALKSYQEHKRLWGVMDFSDQEVLALELLHEKEVVDRLSDAIDLLLVDEFQDTSPIQLAILLRLASLAKKTIWVGDQKQSVYGFRGTDPALMDSCIQHIFQDHAPETLNKSWRSRPPLVLISSAVFARAFASHGIPEERVMLEPALESDDPELGPCIEWWETASKNQSEDASAVAGGVRDLLRDDEVKVRDKKEGKTRRIRHGDIGILCRTNDACAKMAEALESINIRAVLPKAGLMKTPEAMTVQTGLRLWVDPKDTLAAAELARIIHYPDKSDEWLKQLLEKPGAEAFGQLPEAGKIVDSAREKPDSGVLQVLDAVYRIIDIRELCLAWGDAPKRLANLDALSAHARSYIAYSAAEGIGCTPAGLLGYLNELAANEEDSQAQLVVEDAVNVVTLHSAKGLEWPVTILTQIGKKFEPDPLGVKVISDWTKFDINNPLADRWLRYWLFPYHPKNKETPFNCRMEEDASMPGIIDSHQRQELRLLYVAWTRGRDRLILAGRNEHFREGILGLLTDEKGTWLLSEPKDGKAVWAGQELEIRTRMLDPVEPETRSIAQGGDYPIPKRIRTQFPSRLSPSSMDAQGKAGQLIQIGRRIPTSGNPDMESVGNAFHYFFAADRPQYELRQRMALAEGIIKRLQVTGAVTGSDIVESADNLAIWANQEYPEAVWRREWPLIQRLPEGTVVLGFCDLLLNAGNRIAVIDHKAFAGNKNDAAIKAAEFFGQLKAYRDILQSLNGNADIACYIHYPISGLLVEVGP